MTIRWRSANAQPDKVLVKGTHLATGFVVGHGNRFGIYETRSREADGSAGTIYHVRDADGLTDTDMRAGKLAPIVFTDSDPEVCERWIVGMDNGGRF